jgi:uncharacterized protein (TIGR03067 family)
VKTKAFGLAAVLLVGVTAALQAGGQGDKEKIQGTWQLESIKFGDKEISNPGGDATMIFKDGKVTMKGKEQEGSYKIDPSKKPKHIDLEGAFGGGKKGAGKMPGIYELEGDTLKIAFGMPKIEKGADGGITFTPPERPTAFGDKLIIMTLKRVKS